jgi:hypothetical protein
VSVGTRSSVNWQKEIWEIWSGRLASKQRHGGDGRRLGAGDGVIPSVTVGGAGGTFFLDICEVTRSGDFAVSADDAAAREGFEAEQLDETHDGPLSASMVSMPMTLRLAILVPQSLARGACIG